MSNPVQHFDFSATHSQQRTCLRGHVINHEVIWPEEPTQQWCQHCGSAVIGHCPICKGPLRGARNSVPLPKNPKPETYCLHCGKALPWTQTTLAAARIYTDEHLDGLSEDEKTELKATFEDMTTDTALTPVATGCFKKLMAKVAPEVGKGLLQVIVSVLTEEAKRQAGLTP
jgi:hypothetical protein